LSGQFLPLLPLLVAAQTRDTPAIALDTQILWEFDTGG
jgi:hypothetical protein